MSDGPRSIPLSVPVLAGNEQEYVRQCIDSGWVSSAGAFITRFEDAVCELTGAAHAVACSSGTAALHVSLDMLGVRPGDAVIIPTVTFIATANAVRYCGAEPVLLGCDEYLNLDVAALEAYLGAHLDPATGVVADPAGRTVRAIVPVHVYGTPCDMAAIAKIGARFGVPVVEDATESLGSTYASGPLAGRHTGTIGTLGAFSFNGNKIITTGGGGMIVTDDDGLAERARYLTTQAKDDPLRYVHGAVGYNYRLTNVPAAIGVAQMEQLAGFIERKRENWTRYVEGLRDVRGLSFVDAPEWSAPNRWFYGLVVEPAGYGLDREQLMARLADAGVQSRPLWLPIHLQEPYRDCEVVGVERAVWYWERVLSLPCSSDLSPDDVDYVIETIRAGARG